MKAVTEEQITRALAENTEPEWRYGQQGYCFDGSPAWHTNTQARDIVRICLMLDQPVGDVLSSSAVRIVVDKIDALERAVIRLGGVIE